MFTELRVPLDSCYSRSEDRRPAFREAGTSKAPLSSLTRSKENGFYSDQNRKPGSLYNSVVVAQTCSPSPSSPPPCCADTRRRPPVPLISPPACTCALAPWGPVARPTCSDTLLGPHYTHNWHRALKALDFCSNRSNTDSVIHLFTKLTAGVHQPPRLTTRGGVFSSSCLSQLLRKCHAAVQSLSRV